MANIFIIAEAGVNHNGSLETATRLIEIAAEAGADAVKFQTFKTERVVAKAAPKAEYQRATTGKEENQLEMIRRLELAPESHRTLMEVCERKGIRFMSTPFDMESLDFLADELNLSPIKFGSGELTSAPLLLRAAQKGKPVILSTGMSDLGEIETALGVLAFGYLRSDSPPSASNFRDAWRSKEGRRLLADNVTLLQCTTEYPAPFSGVDLRSMDTLRRAFGLRTGLSDHTPGIAVPIAAAAREAAVVEKHFTIDRSLPGPDHKASLESGELKKMVEGIREVEQALGCGIKVPDSSELKNRPIARKSLVAACLIRKGEQFTEANLTFKRPGEGISPIYYWEWLGRKAHRDYNADEML